jgi:hypothetical protein
MSDRLSKIQHLFLNRRFASLEKLLFIAIILTCFALYAGNSLIKTRLVLGPSSSYVVFLGDDRANGGASTAEWVDKESYEWRCTLRKQYEYPYCQFQVLFGGVDLSQYETMKVKLEYSGTGEPNDSVRINLRNNSPIYDQSRPLDVLKYSEMEIPAVYLKGPFIARIIYFNFTVFCVRNFFV